MGKEWGENWEGDYPTLGMLWRYEWRKSWRTSEKIQATWFSLFFWPVILCSQRVPPTAAISCASTAAGPDASLCSQQVLAAEGFGGARWEAGVHCTAKDTSDAKTQPGRMTGLCPCFILWSAMCHPGCAPPLPDTSWDLQNLCQRSLENIPITILSCPLAITCESSVGCSPPVARWTSV